MNVSGGGTSWKHCILLLKKAVCGRMYYVGAEKDAISGELCPHCKQTTCKHKKVVYD